MPKKILSVFAVALTALTVPAATIVKTNNTDNLNLGSSWVGGVAPTSADIAQWDSTVTAANSVALGANANWAGIKIMTPSGAVTLTAGSTLDLAASGIDLSTASQNLTLNCALNLSASQSWSVATNRTLAISNNISGTALLTIPGPGVLTLGGTSYTLGTSAVGNNALALNGGTVSVSSGTLTLNGNASGSDAAHINGNATFNLSGGVVNSSFYTRLGSGAANTFSALNVSGGTFNNTGEILFGFGGSGGSGTLTISGGTVSSHFLRLGDTSASGTHTVNLDGGVLKADRLYRNNATAMVNFNGGQLQVNASPSVPWFAASVSNVFVKNGGAMVNTAGKNVTIEPGLQSFSGSTGGLTKLGTGTLTLAGTNSYAGATTISNGALTVNGQLSGLGGVTVFDGATLGGTGVIASAVSVLDGATLAPGAGLLTLGSLTLGTNASLLLALSAAGSPANSSLKVNGNLTLDGSVRVSDTGGVATNAVYSVINYTGTLTNLGLTVDPASAWDVTVDTSVTNFVQLTATRKFPFLEISNGNLTVTTLYTNLTGVIHGSTTNIVWYEVRSNSLTGFLSDFGAHVPSTVWPFTVRHLKGGTNWVTLFARDNSGATFSNSVALVLNLSSNPPVRPRPIPAEIWWGGLSTNQQLLDVTKPWDFVKKFEDGIFFHSAGYGGLSSADKTDLATMMRSYNTKYWVELGGGTSNPGDAFVQFQAVNGWGAHLTSQQNLGLVMSQITHDYHMENMEDVCRAYPDWTTNNLIAWWTGDMSLTNAGYPFASGLWRDVFQIYYTNNPHLKTGHTSSSVYWWWANFPQLAGAQNNLLYNPLLDTNGVPVQVSGTNVSFSFNGRDVVLGFVRMASQIGHPYFSQQTDFPWDYFGTWGNQGSATTNRAKIRYYERELQSNGARHTLICNISNARSQGGGNDAQDVYYKTNSLNSMWLHQREGGRANVYLFESWYSIMPNTAAPETKNGSYANLALEAIKYLKGIADTNGALENLSLTLLSTNGGTNTIAITNRGDVMCLPAIAGFETGAGAGTVAYYDALGSNITSAILSPEGWAYTNRLTPGQTTTIRVVPSVLPLNRAVTLEAFWNPQDPTGVVRDRLVLSPPNTPPVLNAISNRNVIAGATITFTNIATDTNVPTQTLTFSLLTPPAGATINPSSGIFSWRPAIAQSPSTNPMSVKVTDNGSPVMSATQSFSVFVLRPATPVISQPKLTNGISSLQVSGDSGPDYTLLGATNLNSPVTWLPLKTNLAPLPPFIFTDSAATNFNQRFYRIQIGP